MRINKNNLYLFSYLGSFNSSNTNTLVKECIEASQEPDSKKIKGFIISLNKVPEYVDEEEILNFVSKLKALNRKIKFPIGVIDYKNELYEPLKKQTLNTNIRLYKNITLATLFENPSALKKQLTILLYEPDTDAAKSIVEELEKKYYKIEQAHSLANYKKRLHDEKIDIAITQTCINKSTNTQKLHLNKKLIANISIFIDTAVETLMSLTEMDAKKTQHAISNVKSDIKGNVFCAIMQFSGDLEGKFFLVFPKPIASKAMESLLGEECDEKDIEGIKDGVGELCNIITGSTKTNLQNNNINVVFELPKTFDSIKKASQEIGSNDGIWIDLLLDNEPFYIFITQ